MEEAVAHLVRWCEAHPVAGMALEVVRLPGRTPLIFIEIPGEGDDCLLLYGHLDKQPEMSGWREGLGPSTPKHEGNRLYGRGGVDDGYGPGGDRRSWMLSQARTRPMGAKIACFGREWA